MIAMLSEKERIYLLIMKRYGDKEKIISRVTFSMQLLMKTRFQNPVVRTVQRFIETDSVKDHSRSGPTSASNDEKSATILQSFIETPNTSTRKVATENKISQSLV